MQSRFALKFFNLLAIGTISGLGIIVYSNTFQSSFHFDDLPSIVDNPFIRNIHDLQRIWSFLPRRSLLYLTFAINFYFGQLSVFGYHLLNVGIHLGGALLVWWFCRLTFLTPAMKEEEITSHGNAISLFAGLVFVAHPAQTQAVTYIVQRAASMAALFYLASLCFYIQSRLTQDKRYYFGALILAIMAMFTKETAITLPLMILLYEFSFLKTKQNFNWVYLLPFLLTIFIIPLTMLLTETGPERLQHLQSEPGISSIHYFLTQLRVIITYIRLVFFPLNQNIDYDYPLFKNIFEWPVVSSLLALMTILFFAKRLFLKYRLVSFSILWFLLTLVPESSFLPIKDVIYEHRLYLPLVGYCMFLVSSLYYLLNRYNFKVMVPALTVILAWYSILTYQRNEVWRDELTLWNDTIHKSPNKARGYINRAIAYEAQGNLSQAIADYDKAIEVDPNSADGYYNRGLEYYDQGRPFQAFFDFDRVIKINPNYTEAYNNRGLIYYNQGRFIQAISDYNKAIGINPRYLAAYNNRAIAYYRLKKYNEAWIDVHKAKESGFVVNPEFISALKQSSGRD